jgi:hypothetical protein
MTALPRFDGSDIVQQRDAPRLAGQLARVYECMKEGQWRTLEEIAEICDAPEASVSGQLRNLRKQRFGRYLVEKRYCGSGLYRYRIAGRFQPVGQQLSLL